MDNLAAKKRKNKAAKIVIAIFRTILIFGLCYVILKPFLIKILLGFFGKTDMLDATVKYIPKNWSIYYWQWAWKHLKLSTAGVNSLVLALGSSLLQVFVSVFVGYGLARFKFKGNTLLFGGVIATLLIPPQIYSTAQYLTFAKIIPIRNTYIPVYLLAILGLTVKEGLYIYLMREFFKGMPKDLENAAYVDGASVMRTFFTVMLPNAFNMMITVFLFAFSWQWTDYSFETTYMPEITTLPMTLYQRTFLLHKQTTEDTVGTNIARGCGIMIIIAPLVILAIVCQKFLVKSISQSGLAN